MGSWSFSQIHVDAGESNEKIIRQFMECYFSEKTYFEDMWEAEVGVIYPIFECLPGIGFRFESGIGVDENDAEQLFYLVNKIVPNTYVYCEFGDDDEYGFPERNEIILDPQKCRKIGGSYNFWWNIFYDEEWADKDIEIDNIEDLETYKMEDKTEEPIYFTEFLDTDYLDKLLEIKEKSQEKGFTELSEAIENCFSIIIDGQYIGKRYSIKNAVIPDSVKRIADGVFSACSNLMSVTIPDSVTEIGSFAFRSCQSLTSVTMPANVTSIGKYAFEGCTSLGNITIPESVTEIGSHAFFCCTSLKKLTLFGCTVNSTLWNWDKVDPNEVKSMLASKDYSVKMDRPTKYMFVTQIFLNTAQPEAEAYIKKNAMKIIKWLIDADDYKTVKGLFESGNFVTKRNIMKFLDHSIAHTQNGGDMQIQAYIMDYKNEHFPDTDPLKNVKL